MIRPLITSSPFCPHILGTLLLGRYRTVFLYFVVVDEFSDDLGRFFAELGSGSPEEVPDQSADDETAELAARR